LARPDASASPDQNALSLTGPADPVTTDAFEVVLRPPALVVLIGAAGAGKTTLATRLFGGDEILSSDDLRAAISGDAADQRATRPAFAVLHRDVARRLAGGGIVVVDATSVERPARQTLLRLASASDATTIAVVLALPAELVHARNHSRPDRQVPVDVVDRHLALVTRLLESSEGVPEARLREEGFATVVVARTAADVDRIRFARLPPFSPR
jgi:protein phosphatase